MSSPKRPFDPFETPPPASTPKDIHPKFGDDEVSQVTDMGSFFKKMETLDRALRKMVGPISQIPEVKEKVDNISERVIRVEEKLESSKERVNSLERKVDEATDHGCSQIDAFIEIRQDGKEVHSKIERDVLEGVKTRERLERTQAELEDVETSVKSFSTAKRNFIAGLVSLIFVALSSVGSLVWFLSGLDTQVTAEQRERRESYQRLEKQLQKLGKASDTAPVRQDLETLTKAVEASNGHAEEFCSGMSAQAVRAIKRSIPSHEWPECERFSMR